MSVNWGQVQVDPAVTEHWFDPEAPGQGLEVHRVAATTDAGGLLFATWLTYGPTEPAGNELDRHWFTLQVEETRPSGGVSAIIVQTQGGRFDSEPTDDQIAVGTVELTPGETCDRLTLRYRFHDTATAGFQGRQGEIDLARMGRCPG